MRNIIIVYAILFIFLSVLKTDAAPYHNPINNALIRAIIKVESSGNPGAISREGALGLMQIRRVIWEKELKKAGIIRHKRELFNPEKNIRAGAYILTKYYSQTGCIKRALVKYSGNEKSYYEKVMIAYQRQKKADCRFPFCSYKCFDWESGHSGIKLKWQDDEDYRSNTLEEYRQSQGNNMMSIKSGKQPRFVPYIDSGFYDVKDVLNTMKDMHHYGEPVAYQRQYYRGLLFRGPK